MLLAVELFLAAVFLMLPLAKIDLAVGFFAVEAVFLTPVLALAVDAIFLVLFLRDEGVEAVDFFLPSPDLLPRISAQALCSASIFEMPWLI